MKKEYIIGGLALLGIIGVVAYLRKPKRNSEGFYGAEGTVSTTKKSPCRVCDSGESLYYSPNGTCRRGHTCRQTVREFQMG